MIHTTSSYEVQCLTEQNNPQAAEQMLLSTETYKLYTQWATRDSAWTRNRTTDSCLNIDKNNV